MDPGADRGPERDGGSMALVAFIDSTSGEPLGGFSGVWVASTLYIMAGSHGSKGVDTLWTMPCFRGSILGVFSHRDASIVRDKVPPRRLVSVVDFPSNGVNIPWTSSLGSGLSYLAGVFSSGMALGSSNSGILWTSLSCSEGAIKQDISW